MSFKEMEVSPKNFVSVSPTTLARWFKPWCVGPFPYRTYIRIYDEEKIVVRVRAYRVPNDNEFIHAS